MQKLSRMEVLEYLSQLIRDEFEVSSPKNTLAK